MHEIDPPEVHVVEELPNEPAFGESYSFARLKRDSVTYAGHAIHKYPAKFIPQIPRWALLYKRTSITQREVVLDPFCGSGTTLLEASLMGHETIGLDISPLAAIISDAKLSRIREAPTHFEPSIGEIVSAAVGNCDHTTKTLNNAKGMDVLGLHKTWSNWFDPRNAAELVCLRQAIMEREDLLQIRPVLLTVLSSLVKPASYLNEDQIKVRYDHDKKPIQPLDLFKSRAISALDAQHKISERLASAKTTIEVASAHEMPIADRSVDRIITSPPYINAVDYPMAHKYSLFALNLIVPNEFKEHCREYIGLTERAVRADDLREPPKSQDVSMGVVSDLWKIGTPTARNRAFVVSQYFSLMRAFFLDSYRVLKKDGLLFFVVGESNNICGMQVPTADLLEDIANEAGLRTETKFFHVIANRSSMRLNRSSTGGQIRRETVFVFRKFENA